MRGRIRRISANTYFVRAGDRDVPCKYRGKLKREKQFALKLAAVGDDVEFEPAGAGEGIIEKVLPRRSKLSRHDPQRANYEQVLAANVDQLVVVDSAADPDLNLLIVDKCTVMGMAAGLACAVCINKCDLRDVRAEVEPYAKAGFPLVLTSAAKREGVDELRALLRGRTSVLLGPSGVGKTSLLNALRPDLGLKTGEVSAKTGEGRHTTTWVEILELEPDTFVLDTPGLEFFTLWGVTVENLPEQFPEFAERMPKCRYRATCSHTQESPCEVRAALERGEIARPRYESYLEIRDGLLKKRRGLQ